MGLSDIVRNAVKQADTITKDLHETIELYRWRGQDDTGAPDYAPRKTFKVLVEHKHKLTRNAAGEEVVSTAQVTFLQPIPALSPKVDDRIEPIDPRDKIILANEKTGPILRTDGGLADPKTLDGYVVQVWLG